MGHKPKDSQEQTQVIQRLQTNVPLALDSVTTENIQNYCRKVRHYMFANLQGYAGGK